MSAAARPPVTGPAGSPGPRPGQGRPAPAARRGRRLSRGVHVYIGVEILKTFLLVMLVFEAAMGTMFTYGAVKDFGVDLAVLLPFMGPALAAYLDNALPVSLLFSTALVFGRLTADREIAALKSFGFSYLELALAPAAIGFVFSLLLLFLNFYAIPELRFTRDNLGSIVLDQIRYLGEGSNQSFTLGRRLTLWIERFEGAKLTGILIAAEGGDDLGLRGLGVRKKSDPNETPGVEARSYPLVLYAAEGEVLSDPGKGGRDVALELRGVTLYYDTEYRRGHRIDDSLIPASERSALRDFKQRANFSRFRWSVVLGENQRNDKEVTWPELRRRVAAERADYEKVRLRGDSPGEVAAALHQLQFKEAEAYRRLGLTLCALFFPLGAAALALFLNSPNRLLPVFASLMILTPVFYVLFMFGNRWARSGIAPAISTQAGNLGVLAFAAILFLILRRRTLW